MSAALKAGDLTRLARYRGPAFRRAHPEVVILLRGPLPAAWVGTEKLTRRSLRSLLDKLDELFPEPDTG